MKLLESLTLGGAAALLALATHACTSSPTEALVHVATDVPADRSMRITASISTVGGGDSDSHTWSRAYGDAGGIALPATFAVLPAAGGALDGRVALTLTADVGAGPRGEPAGEIVRTVVFQFAPHQTRRVDVVLARACLDAATGCTSAPTESCTQSALCADQGATCGDLGACVAVDPTHPLDAAVDTDAPVTDAPVTDAQVTDAQVTDAHVTDAPPDDIATDVHPPTDAHPDAAPCGAVGERCCAAASCSAGATCSGSMCVACGAVGQPCCGGDRCNAGAACDARSGSCQCAPDCAGRACGSDGCGGSCGSCSACHVCNSRGNCVARTDGTTCSGPPDAGLYACCAGACTSLTTASDCGGCGLHCTGTNSCLPTATPLCLCNAGACPTGQMCIPTMYISYCACSADAGCASGQTCATTHCTY